MRHVSTGTSGRPLIALHSWRDETAGYERLSAALGSQVIHSLLPPDDRDGPLPRRVETWVDHHEAILDSLDVDPPFRFIGFSFGGVLALELARRLRDRGVGVEYVGLVDSTRPRLVPVTKQDYFWYHLEIAARMEPGTRAAYLRPHAYVLAVRTFPRAARMGSRALRAAGLRNPITPVRFDKPSDPLVVAIHTAFLNYQGEPVTFPVHLYTTEESVLRAETPALRWLPWLHGGYTITEVDGQHFTIFDEGNVASLAAAIRPHLREPGPDATTPRRPPA